MHIELPKVRLHSLKDFAKHYLMIVLSILTALGLEQWIESTHQHHAAAAASARMDVELRADQAEILDALKQNAQTLSLINQLDTAVTTDLKAGLPATTINQDIQAHKNQFQLNLNWPNLSTDAWNVAVANQSAGWIKPVALQRYSAAYARVRQVQGWIDHDALLLLNGPAMVNFLTDLQIGQNVDPRQFLHAVHQIKTTIHSTQNKLRSLSLRLNKALPQAALGTSSTDQADETGSH